MPKTNVLILAALLLAGCSHKQPPKETRGPSIQTGADSNCSTEGILKDGGGIGTVDICSHGKWKAVNSEALNCVADSEPLHAVPCEKKSSPSVDKKPKQKAAPKKVATATLTTHALITGNGNSDSHVITFETQESYHAKQLQEIKDRENLPLWYITVSGHDCDHDPVPVHATDRMDALYEATHEVLVNDDKAGIAFLSALPNAYTVWTEAEWMDVKQRIGTAFADSCREFKENGHAKD